jgi:hypothetical protein
MAGEDGGCAAGAVCVAHPLLVENVVAMRKTFDAYVQHASEQQSKMVEIQARMAEQFHAELMTAVSTFSGHRGRSPVDGAAAGPADKPHPLDRAEDYEQRVILQLSRKDLFRVLGAIAVIMVLVLGIAMLAGERGLTLLPKAVTPK